MRASSRPEGGGGARRLRLGPTVWGGGQVWVRAGVSVATVGEKPALLSLAVHLLATSVLSLSSSQVPETWKEASMLPREPGRRHLVWKTMEPRLEKRAGPRLPFPCYRFIGIKNKTMMMVSDGSDGEARMFNAPFSAAHLGQPPLPVPLTFLSPHDDLVNSTCWRWGSIA